MAERTYLYGYQTTRLTLAQLNTKWTWVNTHPEIQRRDVAMMNDSQDAGFDCGVGEGARSTDIQRSTFLARHSVVTSGAYCCFFEGKKYKLKPGVAHAAPPGASVHEDDLYEGYSLALDLRGWETHWFDANCGRYGLKNFGGLIGPNVNGEEWHFQPIEFANSRKDILLQIKQGVKLIRFPLPQDAVIPAPAPLPPPVADPPPAPVIIQEDDMVVLVIEDIRPPHAVWKSNGVSKTWVRDGDASIQIQLRVAESANGTKPSPVDGFIYKFLRHGDNDVIASYGPVLGPIPQGFDAYGRLL